MLSPLEAFLSIAQTGAHPQQTPACPVVAIVRLSESRRSWFITGVRRQDLEIQVLGFSPGCLHSAGNWFSLEPDFFELAAEASGDELEIRLLDEPIPLEQLEDESL